MHKKQENAHILQLLQFYTVISDKEKEAAAGNIHIVVVSVHNGMSGWFSIVFKESEHLNRIVQDIIDLPQSIRLHKAVLIIALVVEQTQLLL